jgi:hypothetical protein
MAGASKKALVVDACLKVLDGKVLPIVGAQEKFLLFPLLAYGRLFAVELAAAEKATEVGAFSAVARRCSERSGMNLGALGASHAISSKFPFWGSRRILNSQDVF